MKDINFEIKKILRNAMVTSLVNPNVVTLLKSEDEIAEEIVKLCNKPAVSKSLKCDCKHSGSCRYEIVIAESKELCRYKVQHFYVC